MLRPIAPFIEYAINKDYIAKVLCINKEKPKMQCNGKCHLYKKVEQQQEELPVSLEVSLKEYPLGFVKILKLKPHNIKEYSIRSSFYYIKNYHYLFSTSVFHPPSV